MEEAVTEHPRVTRADIESEIVGEHYFTAADGRTGAITAGTYSGLEHPQDGDADLAKLSLITICVLILRNGTKLVGVDEGPVSAANFDAAIGRRYARADATDFCLRERLTQEGR